MFAPQMYWLWMLHMQTTSLFAFFSFAVDVGPRKPTLRVVASNAHPKRTPPRGKLTLVA
ncbi:MAG TPA: hypothetical protein V6D17_11580 [Candidatus Obscuribacterales bacterium]